MLAVTPPEEVSALNQMLQMGFRLKWAEVALEQCAGHLHRAVEFCLTQLIADEAIFHAFRRGGTAIEDLLGILQRAGVSVNFQRPVSDDTTALMAAAYHGHAGAVRALLAAGADPSLRDAAGGMRRGTPRRAGTFECGMIC